MKKLYTIMIIIALAMMSCKKDKNNDDTLNPINTGIGKGAFILNEGNFTNANSSLTFYDYEANTVTNNLFYRVNNAPIGDVGQSLTIINNDLFIVVNNSKYIYKVDVNTLKYKAKLDNLYSPRYMMPISASKAYVSDLAGTGLWIINPETMTQTGFIETGKTTEKMVKVGNEVYVANWSKQYQPEMENNSVQVIDTESDLKIAEITVSLEPNSLVVDKNNNIWVLCDGGYLGEEKPILHCINPSTKQIIKQIEFGSVNDYPSCLTIDASGENMYFLNGDWTHTDVYKISIDDTELSQNPFISGENRMFYNLSINTLNGDVYVTDAKTYTINGDVLIYSSNGTLKKTFEAGICPSFILFN